MTGKTYCEACGMETTGRLDRPCGNCGGVISVFPPSGRTETPEVEEPGPTFERDPEGRCPVCGGQLGRAPGAPWLDWCALGCGRFWRYREIRVTEGMASKRDADAAEVWKAAEVVGGEAFEVAVRETGALAGLRVFYLGGGAYRIPGIRDDKPRGGW